MGILVVGTMVTKPENRDALLQLWQKFFAYMRKNTELFQEVKSFKVFSQMFGGAANGFVELVEYDSLADYEKLHERLQKDSGYVKLIQEFLQLVDPATLSEQVWKSVMQN